MRVFFFRIFRPRWHPWLFVVVGFLAAGAFGSGAWLTGVLLLAVMAWLVVRA